MTTAEELVIRKSVDVPLPVEAAFALFTARAGEWWPLATHSTYGDEAEDVVFEPRQGGRFFERSRAGEEDEWGRVLVYDPPHRFVVQWLVDPRCTGELELRFRAEAGGTRVELKHRGWELYGDGAEQAMTAYGAGWEVVLARYRDAAGR